MKIANADGLANCRKLLQAAKQGKYDGYLLEGMGCPGGCVGGAGTMISLTRVTTQLLRQPRKLRTRIH